MEEPESPSSGATPQGERPKRTMPWWGWLGVCLGLALALRVGITVAFHSIDSLTIGGKTVTSPALQPLFPDSLEYIRMAKNIVEGDGPMLSEREHIARMPGYPYFLGLFQKFFDDDLLPVRLAQAALGTLAVWLTYLLARRLYGRGEGLVAAAASAVYPAFVVFTVLVLSEALFVVLLLCGVLCLLAAVREERGDWALLAGVVFGAGTLVRASFLLFAPFAALAWLVLRRFDRKVVAPAVGMAVASVVVLAPWVVRNWRASDGHVVVTTLRTGASLYEALNPEADGGPMMHRINWSAGTAGLSEVERDRLWRRRAVKFALTHPGRVVVLALRKLGRFWNVLPNEEQFRHTLLVLGLGVPYAAVMLAAVGGLARSWRRRDVALILLLPVVYYSLLHMVFVGSIRYRVVVMPLAVVLAAHGAVELWGRIRRMRGRAAAHGDRADVQ